MTSWTKFTTDHQERVDEAGNTSVAPYDGNPVVLLLHDGMVVGYWEPPSVSNGPDGEDHDGFYWYESHTGDPIEWDTPIAWQPVQDNAEAMAMQEAYRKEQWPDN